MSERARLLVVEDESTLASGLKLNFELDGYAVDVAGTARDASRFLLDPRGYAVIVLDVQLPDLDGFSLCKNLRDAGNYTPVIMLTARSSPDDRVLGLEAGADDYLVKPFVLGELTARIKSMLRRRAWEKTGTPAPQATAPLVVGTAEVRFDTHEIVRGDTKIPLTQLELDLLRYFAEHPGRVIPRDELLEKVWKLRRYPHTRTVDNFIVRLRKMLEPDPTEPRFFLSVRGAGYKFSPTG